MDVPLTDRQKRLRPALAAANIHNRSFLATDYLNIFNEIIMMLDMLPDMPDIFEDINQWRPKSYIEHFQDSNFHDKDLAIEAYECALPCYRRPFDTLVDRLDRLIVDTISDVEKHIDDEDMIGPRLEQPLGDIKDMLGRLNKIIHGSVEDDGHLQSDDEAISPCDEKSQARIDVLFD